MVACDDASTSQNIAMPIGNGQDVGRFAFLASLIGHRLATFLGKGMTAIQIELFEVQISLNHRNTVLPDPFQASVPAPLAGVVVDRLPTDFLFVGSVGSRSIGI